MTDIFQYNFFSNALLAALFASISCGYIGTYIVTRRIVFISGGISHASFGGIGLAYFLGINPLIGAGVFSLFAAFGIEALSSKAELRMDSLIGMMWSLGMATGIIFIFLTPGYAANLMTYLFGNILTVSVSDLYFMALVCLAIAAVFFVLFRAILYASFDPEYASTLGIPVTLINYLLMGLVALTIIVNIRVVGIILVIALLTIPQATASLFSKTYKSIILLAVLFGILSSIGGLVLSYFLNIPSGATIIFLSVLIFVLSRLLLTLFSRQGGTVRSIKQ
jgi:zinc transport system permease protein